MWCLENDDLLFFCKAKPNKLNLVERDHYHSIDEVITQIFWIKWDKAWSNKKKNAFSFRYGIRSNSNLCKYLDRRPSYLILYHVISVTQPMMDTRRMNVANEQLASRRKAAKMLITVVLAFAVCYFPVHLLNISRYFYMNKLNLES